MEVKWHAPLSEQQIEHQIVAAKQNGHTVAAVMMLGEAGVEDKVSRIPCVRRTWRDVSSDLQTLPNAGMCDTDTPFERWARIMRDFLQQTDMGHVFAGIDPRKLRYPGVVAYQFNKPGYPPWFSNTLETVKRVRYRFGERE